MTADLDTLASIPVTLTTLPAPSQWAQFVARLALLEQRNAALEKRVSELTRRLDEQEAGK